MNDKSQISIAMLRAKARRQQLHVSFEKKRNQALLGESNGMNAYHSEQVSHSNDNNAVRSVRSEFKEGGLVGQSQNRQYRNGRWQERQETQCMNINKHLQGNKVYLYSQTNGSAIDLYTNNRSSPHHLSSTKTLNRIIQSRNHSISSEDIRRPAIGSETISLLWQRYVQFTGIIVDDDDISEAIDRATLEDVWSYVIYAVEEEYNTVSLGQYYQSDNANNNIFVSGSDSYVEKTHEKENKSMRIGMASARKQSSRKRSHGKSKEETTAGNSGYSFKQSLQKPKWKTVSQALWLTLNYLDFTSGPKQWMRQWVDILIKILKMNVPNNQEVYSNYWGLQHQRKNTFNENARFVNTLVIDVLNNLSGLYFDTIIVSGVIQLAVHIPTLEKGLSDLSLLVLSLVRKIKSVQDPITSNSLLSQYAFKQRQNPITRQWNKPTYAQTHLVVLHSHVIPFSVELFNEAKNGFDSLLKKDSIEIFQHIVRILGYIPQQTSETISYAMWCFRETNVAMEAIGLIRTVLDAKENRIQDQIDGQSTANQPPFDAGKYVDKLLSGLSQFECRYGLKGSRRQASRSRQKDYNVNNNEINYASNSKQQSSHHSPRRKSPMAKDQAKMTPMKATPQKAIATVSHKKQKASNGPYQLSSIKKSQFQCSLDCQNPTAFINELGFTLMKSLFSETPLIAVPKQEESLPFYYSIMWSFAKQYQVLLSEAYSNLVKGRISCPVSENYAQLAVLAFMDSDADWKDQRQTPFEHQLIRDAQIINKAQLPTLLEFCQSKLQEFWTEFKMCSLLLGRMCRLLEIQEQLQETQEIQPQIKQDNSTSLMVDHTEDSMNLRMRRQAQRSNERGEQQSNGLLNEQTISILKRIYYQSEYEQLSRLARRLLK